MNQEPGSSAPRVAVLTPEGRGAIAVVRVWGPRAVEVADRAFRPVRGESLARTAPGRLRFGRIGAQLGDEVVAVVVPGTVPEVEIQCHGGSAAVSMVLDALAAEGAERRQPVAWIRHGARSGIAAEADVDLMRTETTRTAEILLEQSQGALEAALARCLEAIESSPAAGAEAVQSLLQRAELGQRLVSGWRVVLSGRPNVGKSRLLNALAGYTRAIVAPTPGTTRDVVTVRTALEGWPVELADTAGLRDADDLIEASGIAMARTHQQAADLILLVLDGSEPLTEADRRLLGTHPEALIIASKSDLPPAWAPEPIGALSVSAERGEGLERLGRAIADRLAPHPPSPGAGVPFRPAHIRRLRTALEAIEAGDLAAAGQALSELLVPPAPTPDPA